MRITRCLAHIALCVGLLFQISVPAAALPQAETMSAMDCAKMKHHASQGSEHAGHSDAADGQCEDMSLACLVSMNAAAPVFLGSEFTRITDEFFANRLRYISEGDAQLLSCHSSPDYPPPRF
ncbi:hypothetical protein EH31_10490 [Erythrobacter longus]|uniref:DUF2946 domain-containing protein n=1 Tax=Erythrobacter longus TaxID=1044 RepID=A0A074M6W6_ERYLO|nr:hypothetical protein EH31_10490 [Erythrobacter longus]